MNAEKYAKDNLAQFARELRLGGGFIFQKNNDPNIQENTTQVQQCKCSGLAKSKPTSQCNLEFVAELKKNCCAQSPSSLIEGGVFCTKNEKNINFYASVNTKCF